MPFFHIVVLALIQGLTEFLPISSSGHLILAAQFLQWPPQGKLMDVAIHVGTLGAILVYFWNDIFKLFKNLPDFLKGHWHTSASKETLCLLIGTIPAIIVGFSICTLNFYSLKIIAFTSLFYGLLLYLVDKKCSSHRTYDTLTFKDAFYIGCAQALALIPGTSRSGICITAGRFLGFNQIDAAKFSFMLSIPAISAAAVLTSYNFLKLDQPGVLKDITFGIVFSFAAGSIAIHFMMRWLKRGNFTPFVIYRMLLGIFLLYLSYKSS